MLKRWVVCAAVAALVGVGSAVAQELTVGQEAAVLGTASGIAIGGVNAAGAPVWWAPLSHPGIHLGWGAAVAPAAFTAYGVYKLVDARRRKAAERAECDALPRFQPRELREHGVENRVQCRRRHRGVEPGRFQPTFGRQATREFTPSRESCVAYWRLSPRFRVQCRGTEHVGAPAVQVLPAVAVERLGAEALERQRVAEIASERARRQLVHQEEAARQLVPPAAGEDPS